MSTDIADIEQVLSSHPQIQGVVIEQVSDLYRGAAYRAVLHTDLTLPEVVAHAEYFLAPGRVPLHWHLVPVSVGGPGGRSLPRSNALDRAVERLIPWGPVRTLLGLCIGFFGTIYLVMAILTGARW